MPRSSPSTLLAPSIDKLCTYFCLDYFIISIFTNLFPGLNFFPNVLDDRVDPVGEQPPLPEHDFPLVDYILQLTAQLVQLSLLQKKKWLLTGR